jgi:copper chaperone CopZ
MNIDNALEEIPGVISSKTNYAKGETEIIYQPGKSVVAPAKKAIERLGYQVVK